MYLNCSKEYCNDLKLVVDKVLAYDDEADFLSPDDYSYKLMVVR